jgi:hypothetical protein
MRRSTCQARRQGLGLDHALPLGHGPRTRHADDPAALGLQEAESRTLLAAMQPYFDDDGITLHHVPALGPERWLAEGELFRSLPTASLDRVLGRNVDPWLPKQDKEDAKGTARKMKLLQNEMQMLLYTHALERRARGAAAVAGQFVLA